MCDMGSRGVRRRAVSGLAALALVPVFLASTTQQGAEARPAARYPSEITTTSATPGPGPGEVTIRWKSKGDDVDYWKIETALTPPNQVHADDPGRGWISDSFKVPGGAKARSITLTAAQTAAAGAGVGSGNTLLTRVLGIRKHPKQTRYSKLLAAPVMGIASQAAGDEIRVASYNIRIATKDGPGPHSWDTRVKLIAKNIADVAPDIVGLQEAVPSMLTDEYRPNPGDPVLMSQDLLPDRYQLVRAAPMRRKSPSLPMDARILYDATKFKVVSDCDESVEYGDPDDAKTCSIKLPSAKADKDTKFAAYAKFEVLSGASMGQQFWFVSAHADSGNSRDVEVLRAKQTEEIAKVMDEKNAGLDLPIIFTADTNSYQASPNGNDTRVEMLDHGYYDTASAVQTVNMRYNSPNQFVTPQLASANGFGTRLDVVMTKNLPGADLFEIVRTDDNPDFPQYPSDHNMVFAEFRLPVS